MTLTPSTEAYRCCGSECCFTRVFYFKWDDAGEKRYADSQRQKSTICISQVTQESNSSDQTPGKHDQGGKSLKGIQGI